MRKPTLVSVVIERVAIRPVRRTVALMTLTAVVEGLSYALLGRDYTRLYQESGLELGATRSWLARHAASYGHASDRRRRRSPSPTRGRRAAEPPTC